MGQENGNQDTSDECCDRGWLNPCANAYLGRGLKAGHGLGQDLLLARRERAVAASRISSLGSGGSRAVLGVVGFACHVEKMQKREED